MSAGPGGDRGARYLILHGDADEPETWLHVGEALSAVLLAATADGLATAPISDVVEVRGHPYVVVRVGIGQDPHQLPPTPRRDPHEVIDIVE
jgi:hypothetical protein